MTKSAYNSLGFAWGVTEDDIENVLQANALHVANTNGASFESMAAELFHEIDHERVSEAALAGGDDIETQTDAALREIHRILAEMGILEVGPEGARSSRT